MKRIFILLTVCLIWLTGCDNNKPSANLPQNSNNGSQSVGTNDSAKQTPPSDSIDASADNHVSSVESTTGDVIEIKEKLFISQTNDIYYNAEDYLGKMIKYEGIFDVYEVAETDTKYYSVIRYGPGCCGDDANAGFEVRWDKDYPFPNDWVEAVGILEEYDEDGLKYLRLALSSLTVLPTRGAEYVSQ